MENKRKIALAVAAVAILGFGSLAWNSSSDQQAATNAEHGADDGHGHDKKAGSANKENSEAEHSEDGHGEEGHGEEGHSEEGGEEEGKLTLSAEQIKAAGVTLESAAPRDLGTVVSFPGEIRFDEDRTAHVVPRVPGVVETVQANLGESVKKGQVLAVIASQQISDLRSEQQAAQRRVELARVTFSREKQLWQDKISAEQDYLQARQALQEAEISLANAKQKVSAIGASVNSVGGNRYELRAPFDAVVVEKHLTVGEVVSEATNAFILSDLNQVWATFAVPPSDLAKVTTGRAVKVSSPDMNVEVEGKVGYVGSLLGEQNRAATVRVTLTNPNGAWRPGLFVNIAVTSQTDRVAVAVPEHAVQTVEDKPSVFVRTAEGFDTRPVKLGRRDSGYVEITDGIEAGAQVATNGSFTLKSELGKASAEHSH
ncbi:Cobalt-zinc-cadmium resistance protein CzcB [compost metagenome]|jgi:cobalt-zinc-cadmium efflux system membrane fusion protein|uniref:Efflux RND transporter periplasmic adaptor subunit n=1 Tax=Pseudomonas sp. 13.2 TaxID=3144665 RepID=A0AAU7BCL0_9PSED|nr:MULTISPECIES: efflux RND transporter periplasmic adaptor subunit [Pseudomonas]MBG6125515.1 cobalt-zinc-cadmium efflux system membrane fusion protein [Pseudomonas sp. M2]MCI1036029.1 efflux RND transporter periplasmic adaptor subunit [Pseudomonas putida]MDH0707551.1 efflux RND transporter periplasmic adaptor subunit [Pseudomonas sp. GD03862]WVM67095.1 efflux RND transporter periplasmic adaptor subunit [Pseudomonas putida]HDS1747767.1 efflux RND transporter periplasmic adaptor subunit [Pseudo